MSGPPRTEASHHGPRLRDALDHLPAYVPGRRPGGAVTWKASSNENPYPPLPGVLEAVVREAGAMNRYPDMTAGALVAEIARRFDVREDQVATGTGSVGVLQQVVQSTSGPGDEVVFAWRTFEAYPIVVGVAGATSVTVALTAGEEHDLEAMADAVTPRTRLVLVCSPNNPTGTAVRRRPLERFLDRIPDDVVVVVDEAYHEFVRDPDVPDALGLCRERANLCVLRTFSKAYGLAGLRVGFAVAHVSLAEALRKTAVPFGVSGPAQVAAIASLRSEHELAARVEALVHERIRMARELASQGWRLAPSEANFLWLRLGARAVDFATACEQAGVTVRPFPGEGVRVTVAEPEANDLVLAVASRWVP